MILAARFKDQWPSSFSAAFMTSMALNLLVLPTLAVRYGRFGRARDELEQMAASRDGHG